MGEVKVVVIFSAIFLILGGVIFYFESYYEGFNFYKAEISVDGNVVTERVYYRPDKPYHVLFRNFEDELIVSGDVYNGNYLSNFIELETVSCKGGTAYVNNFLSDCYEFPSGEITSCLPYTESNEYGCSFGEEYGFKENEEYWIEARYVLTPENIFEINGERYVKFIAYSKGKHKYFDRENLVVDEGIIRKDRYLPKEYVILYIPFEKDVSFGKVIQKNSFEFERSSLILNFLLAILPTLIFFSVWFFFGKERIPVNIPEELSCYPNKRKAWEVASVFTSASYMGDNFISTLLTDFYHRKIVDIKVDGEKILIKLLKSSGLDEIEMKFFEFLKTKSNGKEYSDFNEVISPLDFKRSKDLINSFNELSLKVQEKRKEYFESSVASVLILVLSSLGLIVLSVLLEAYAFAVFFFFFLMICLIIFSSTIVFTKYKGEHYREYCEWQSFKRHLSNSFSIKEGTHLTTVMWGEYLIYATALGVSKKVLKELRANGLINDEQYKFYTGIGAASTTFMHSSSGGGGFGGASPDRI